MPKQKSKIWFRQRCKTCLWKFGTGEQQCLCPESLPRHTEQRPSVVQASRSLMTGYVLFP